MSRRGNCYDNAVVESFLKTLKKELVRKQVFLTREDATSKIFEYIEMTYSDEFSSKSGKGSAPIIEMMIRGKAVRRGIMIIS